MKPGAFTQLYIHLVFAVKYREALLHKNVRPGIFQYMSGILTNMKHKSIIINGMPDHVHVLLGLNPNVSISDTVHDLKRSTSLLINDQKLFPGKFAWQEGYGAFSYSRSQLKDIYKYIEEQELHHSKKTFKEEYNDILKKFDLQFEEKYLFEFFE
jgi:REP element-mobilizing transposase RayT